jgi:hypothetical protein
MSSHTVQSRSGLPGWSPADLPRAPRPSGVQWLGVVGPGIIVLGASIGSGEFLLGPAVFVRYGLTLLWITAVAVWLQTVFNTELMRYTVATGEPVFTGFMRTRPSSTGWAWFYSIMYFLQSGWPAWAANAAGAVFFLIARRLATPDDAAAVYYLGVATFGVCVAVLLVGRRIERTLELLNWVLVVCIFGTFIVLALVFVPAGSWLAAGAGLAGFDVDAGEFVFIPENMDFVLLAAFVGYAGLGGITNVTLSNWARDRGYGMGERAGYIPAAVGGKHVPLSPTGFMFEPTPANMAEWRGWWRVVRADQWGVFFVGGIIGMVLPALLYVTILPAGTDIRGLAIASELASGIGARAGTLMAGIVALLAVWILVKTQLDQLDALVRSITDMLWAGSARVRSWRGGDVRAVYYGVLALAVVWALIALRMSTPIGLLQLGANVASGAFVVTSLHLLYINTRLLPEPLRPPRWRRVALVAMAAFYGFFAVMALSSL